MPATLLDTSAGGSRLPATLKGEKTMEYIEAIFDQVVAWFAKFSFIGSGDIGFSEVWDSLIKAIADAIKSVYSA